MEPEPPSSLVFRRKPAPDVCRAPNSVFCPEKPANSSPLNSSPLVTASSPLAFWVQKSVKSGQFPSSFSAGFSRPDSPPRSRLGVRQPRVGLQVGCPSLQVRSFSAENRPRRQFSAFGPEKRRIPARRACPACHRFVEVVRQPAELVTTDVTTDVTAPSGSGFW